MKTIGLGNPLLDVLVRLSGDELLSEVGLLKNAMVLIDREKMLEIRSKVENLPISMIPGGSSANTIRAMATLGAPVGYLGKIGTDTYGDFYEEQLIKKGAVSHLLRKDTDSGISTVLISTDGERTMGTYLGPAAELVYQDITEDILSQYDTVYIEGYLIINDELFRGVLKDAKRLGLKVALDLASFNVVEDNKATLLEVIPEYVDILFANEEEAAAFTGKAPVEALHEIAQMVDIAVVKVGAKGAYISQNGEVTHVEVYGGAPIDTTGAGDCFAAGFLYGLTQQAEMKACGELGSLLGGTVIAQVGPEIPESEWEQIKLKVNEILG